ncbi:hypothetical protein GIB67_011310 [Kingdonia uniflora]|uniref:Uncharacterized protein n=1 Tax=Kingdonia uniflora TaxID=39325 RepID=A0A7J7MNJ6_9MAGN|nr:hypothetical protein GIB67_011310 [Kingdonia uniflora]
MLTETIISWRRHEELEEKSIRVDEESGAPFRVGNDSTFSALDEDDLQTVVIENKLGCDIYLKKAEQNSETVELLPHEQSASTWMPPPRFSDRLNVAGESRESRRYVAVQIFESRYFIGVSRLDLRLGYLWGACQLESFPDDTRAVTFLAGSSLRVCCLVLPQWPEILKHMWSPVLPEGSPQRKILQNLEAVLDILQRHDLGNDMAPPHKGATK